MVTSVVKNAGGMFALSRSNPSEIDHWSLTFRSYHSTIVAYVITSHCVLLYEEFLLGVKGARR
jgi:hypothetical protein